MSPVIFLWAHSRSASTAFVRMMIERGDVIVLHEPLLALTEEGSITLPAPRGGGGADSSGPTSRVRGGTRRAGPVRASSVRASSVREFLGGLAELGRSGPVFVKEVLDYRYSYLIERPREIAWITHTFLVRDPRLAISSHYAMKPTVTCPEIGYERLHELFQVTWSACGRKPLVIRAEDLLREPERVVGAYCEAVGLPFRPEALTWSPQDRPEWQRHRAWHLDAIRSTGFRSTGYRGEQTPYAATVDNNAALRSFYDYHYPFYEQIVQHAI